MATTITSRQSRFDLEAQFVYVQNQLIHFPKSLAIWRSALRAIWFENALLFNGQGKENMNTLLHINSSVRTAGSISRRVTGEFLAKWKAAHPTGHVVERDLAASPVPHLTETTLGAFFTPVDQRTPELEQAVALSDQLVAELMAADVIVIGAPMYNFSVPSGLKAWIDQVARAGLTFKYSDSGPIGLLEGKKAYIFTARGGIYSRGPAKAMDFHETYLRAVLGFIGLTDITFIHSEGLSMGAQAVEDALAQTRNAIVDLAV